jgi:hypothetical protein
LIEILPLTEVAVLLSVVDRVILMVVLVEMANHQLLASFTLER